MSDLIVDPDLIESRGLWGARAEALLALALSEAQDDIDAIPTTSAALAALQIEVGELPESELDGWFDEPECICSPEQIERGGFRGGCPVHSTGVGGTT